MTPSGRLNRTWGSRPHDPTDRPAQPIGPRVNRHLPPREGRPVHGEEAIAEARRLIRLSHAYGLGPRSKSFLLAVAKGQLPLDVRWWSKINAFYARRAAEHDKLGLPHTREGHRLYLEHQRKNKKIRLKMNIIPGYNS